MKKETTERFTHLAEIYGFRCYYNVNTGDIYGTNWWNRLMIDIFVTVDVGFEINDGFYIKLINEL